jgi:hypothetical protein
MKVYCRINGKLACWKVDTENYALARSMVGLATNGQRKGPVLAVIDGIGGA